MGNAVRRVLVVDDSQHMREIVGEVVTSLGYQVFEAENGEKALSLLNMLGEVDATITDYHMPVMDGEEFTRRVKKSFSGTKVIFMSNVPIGEFKAVAEEAGADEVLSKNDIVEKLPAILNGMFGSPNPLGQRRVL